MFNSVVDAFRDVVAMLFPVDCAGCGAWDRALCERCRERFRTGPHAGQFLVEQFLDDGTRVVSVMPYEAEGRAIILRLKEHGRTDVVRALARPLRAAIECAAGSDGGVSVEVCTVPASTQSQRRRGYRPVDLLTRAAGFRLARVLTLSAMTVEQKSLDRAHRAANLQGVFIAHPSVRGRRFVIVDDVVTSGATICEAVRALREGGAEVVAAATLAFTPRRRGPKSIFSVRARDFYSEGRYGG